MMLFRDYEKKHTFWRQLGQSMAEYTVVLAALVGGLLVANQGACPNDYEDCIEYLLTTMHDNYDGYSSSISAVHEYATDYEVADSGEGWSNGDGDGGDGSGSSGGGADGGVPEGLTQSTVLTSAGGMNNLGTYDASTGIVTEGGVAVGTYSSDTGEFISSDNVTISNVQVQNVVVDEDGNVLQRRAITDCATGDVYGFGYESQAAGHEGEFYDSLQLNSMDIGSSCSEPAFGVITKDGSEDGGRIVDGFYYASSQTPALASSPTEPTGEVVYWDFGPFASGICSVMVAGWDDSIEAGGEVDMDDPDEVYAAQLALFSETDSDKDPKIGSQDNEHYVQQVFLNGESGSPNDCVSNRVISVPND